MNLQLRSPLVTKQLGAFYTPQATARLLADWAIRKGTDRFLEPSVGGGALLFAGIARCELLGCSDAQFAAIDIDSQAIAALRANLKQSAEVLCGDFLRFSTKEIGVFDAVIANPPFTRNHSLGKSRRASLRKRFEIEGAAGLWVHFILHSLSFLKCGGRVATIVPASAGFTRYGQNLLRRMCREFASVRLLTFPNKIDWEQKADERGAIIFADGYLQGPCADYEVEAVDSSLDDQPINEVPEAFDFLMSKSVLLGDIASLRIGAVTGNNRVFLLSEAERKEYGLLKSWLRPVISRARHVQGLTMSKADLLTLGQRGEMTWLLNPKHISGKRNPAKRRLNKISTKERRETLWFAKREPWWKVDVGKPSDAVFTYMNNAGPRLALVERGIHCTNTLHKVTFKKSLSKQARLFAILSLYSSFGQLAAERIGRVYGGGVLKFELKEARSLPILILPNKIRAEMIKKVNKLLRDQDYATAMGLVDELLLEPFFGRKWEEVAYGFRRSLEQRRRIRQFEINTEGLK